MCRRILIVLLAGWALAGCNLTASQPTPVPTPDLPGVEFLYPADGSSVIEGTDLTIDLIARDESQGINRIELLLNGIRLREAVTDSDAPVPAFRVEMNWLAQGAGLHVLTAVAYRPDGIRSDEADITIEVLERDSS
jgi:hypothetical protein